MWRKIKPHTDLHEVLDGWHEPFRASRRYVIDKYLYFGSQSHSNWNLAFLFFLFTHVSTRAIMRKENNEIQSLIKNT